MQVNISNERDDKLAINILSIDMSKAFDSLNPPLLLSKLKAHGFQERLMQLLNSHLCDILRSGIFF